MGITLSSTATNNADWKLNFQFNDGDTGDLIDFTGASIEIEVRDRNKCLLIEATTANGKITIVSTGVIQLLVPASEMTNLCAGQYDVGGLYVLNDETISLFTGEVQIRDGVARV